jgi:hypothetical protein
MAKLQIFNEIQLEGLYCFPRTIMMIDYGTIDFDALLIGIYIRNKIPDEGCHPGGNWWSHF